MPVDEGGEMGMHPPLPGLTYPTHRDNRMSVMSTRISMAAGAAGARIAASKVFISPRGQSSAVYAAVHRGSVPSARSSLAPRGAPYGALRGSTLAQQAPSPERRLPVLPGVEEAPGEEPSRVPPQRTDSERWHRHSFRLSGGVVPPGVVVMSTDDLR